MKKYVLYTLKRFIPLYAVTFAIFMSVFFTFCANTSFQVAQNNNTYYINTFSNSVDSGILVFAIPLAILTTILPLFANNYRYSIKSADLFYQTAKGKKSIRFVNNLVLLAMVLIVFTAAFTFAVFLLFLRQIPIIGKATSTVVTSTDPYVETTYDNYFFNFVFYIPAYLLLVITATLNFFISYFLVSRANNFLNSLITLILGEVILGLGIFIPISFMQGLLGSYNITFYDYAPIGGTRTACIVGPIALIYAAFNQLITGYGSNALIDAFSYPVFNPETDIFGTIMMSLGLLIFIGMGVLGILYFLKEDEASGEYAGRAPGRDNFQIIIFHVAFGLIGMTLSLGTTISSILGISLLSALTSTISLISSSVFFAAIYYVFLGLLRRNFRLNKKELIILLSVNLVNLIINITHTVLILYRAVD